MLKRFFEDKASVFYFVFRIIIGFVFVVHGAQKFGWVGGGDSVALVSLLGLAAVIEFFGGSMILFGVFVRVVAVIMGLEMAYVYLAIHLPQGWNPLTNFGEPALLFFASLLVLMAYGAGKWAIVSEKKN